MIDKDSYEKISEKFKSSFVPESSGTKNTKGAKEQLSEIEEKKHELQNIVKDNKNQALVLGDQQFLQRHVKHLIGDTLDVMDTLKRDLKIGTGARKFEAYSALANSATAQIKELRELNKMIADMEIFQGEIDNKQNKSTIDVKMNSVDFMNFVRNIRKESELSKIDAEFEVEEEEEKDVFGES